MANNNESRPGPMMGPGGRRHQFGAPKMAKGELKKIVKRLIDEIFAKHKNSIFIVLTLILVNTGASIYGTLFLKDLINNYITPLINTSNPDFSGLGFAVLKLALIYTCGVLATLAQSIIMRFISNGALLNIRKKMFDHTEKLPIGYFDTHTHGEVMSRYTNDVDTLRQMVSQSLPMVVGSIITLVGVLTTMFILSIHLTIVVLVMYFLIMFVIRKITRKASKYFIKQQQSIGSLNGYIEEMIEGQKVVKVFCHEKESIEGFDQKNEELCDDAKKANANGNMIMPIMNNLGHLNYAVIAIVGSILTINGIGGLNLGTIASFLQFTRTLSQPITQVSQQINSIISALAGAKRIFALLDEPIEKDNGFVTLVNINYENGFPLESEVVTNHWAWKVPTENGKYDYVELKGDVRFFDVDFGYTKDKKVLNDVSLFAKPGQKIAFVGHTGAGKTTITNLVNRFYDIDSGKITFDGIDIKDIKKPDLRRSLGMVLQDTSLFTGTIKDNIKFGKLDATDDEVIAAAKLANADGFIMKLPSGYDTELSNNGSNLSQGQRQLLSIARAAIANTPVLVLDEATSSIDTRTEKIIQEGMDKLMENRTVFVIAHRLSTVRNAKAIMVIDNGEIIERGSHEDLMAQKGKYYSLNTGAFELE
ncbi:MAG: ABC transporter ATP-binding protein/permease [Bacilli bacterium]|nr:ABC transporter ATP-binding protein/permease [Bacilli bacterium]